MDDLEVGHFWGGGSEVEGTVVVVVGRKWESEGGFWRGKMEGLEGSGEDFLGGAEHGWDFLWLFISGFVVLGDTLYG